MNKTVTERDFKFFTTYDDALNNSNFSIETIEFEGVLPPERVTLMSDNFRLKTFSRSNDGVTFLETAYIKTNS